MATAKMFNQGSNPYSAWAIVLDTTPIAQYYLNEQAKKQAKDEALDKYYQDEMSKISSEGMRSQDIPIFSDKFNKLKEMWVMNKDAIKNPAKDGFQKAQEYNRLRQELLNLPSLSKQAKEEKAQGLKLTTDPSKRDLLDIPTFSESMGLHDLPLNDPNRKNLDLANPPFLAKLMTPQEKQNYIKSNLSLIGTEGKFGQTRQIDKYTTETPYTEEYSNQALKMAADKAKIDASSNPSLRRTVELDFQKIPVETQAELNKAHMEFYGKPIQNASDMIAAEILQAGRMAKKVEQKRAKDWEAQQALMFAQSLAKIGANKAGAAGEVLQGNLFDNIGTDVTLEFKNPKTKQVDRKLRNGIITNTKDDSPYNGEVFIQREYIPQGIYSALKSSGVDNDVLLANQGFKARVKDGRIVGLTDPMLGYIDRQSMENAQLKFNTEPQKGVQPTFGQVAKPQTVQQKAPQKQKESDSRKKIVGKKDDKL